MSSPHASDLTRIAHLEYLVEHLYQQLGVPLPAPANGVSTEVRELAMAGKEIAAIKLHREQTGKSLGEAKADVDAVA